MQTFISDISGREFPLADKVSASMLRNSIIEVIRKEKPGFSGKSVLSLDELNYYREKYVSDYLVKEVGELSDLEKTVLGTLEGRTTLSDKLEDAQTFTFGQKIADRVASFGGSWRFIIAFGVMLLLWISANGVLLANKGFDPYPFILLNLILSCIAALQAPVIMMSQNRQEEKDRERSKKDYMINLKSELEIRILHEKIDHLLMSQQQQLIEIQKVQIDMMRDILSRLQSPPLPETAGK